jgi:AcrR family transcriptional regulator
VVRTKNRWGQGSHLRQEIIAAATAVLEETGSEDAITLRGVARRAGISAPSIYAHFPDRDAIVNAVVAEAFADLDAVLATAVEGERHPVRRLRRVCTAYLAFADGMPHRYRVAFGRTRSTDSGSLPAGSPLDRLSGGQAFGRLVEAVDAATVRGPAGERSGARASALLDATALWVALHGYATLRASVPAFPWPGREEMLTVLLRGRDPEISSLE